jgi:hypothetical protein
VRIAAIDRLSRGPEHISGLFNRMSCSDVRIFTLSEGDVSDRHVAPKGPICALFRKDPADKRAVVGAALSTQANRAGALPKVTARASGASTMCRGMRTKESARRRPISSGRCSSTSY